MTRAAVVPAPGFGEVPPAPDRRAIPFEYAFRFDLRGLRENNISSTVTVSVEAAFTAISIGYGVIPAISAVTFGPNDQELFPVLGATSAAPPPPPSFPLADIEFSHVLAAMRRVLGAGTDSTLAVGIRLNPQLANLALLNNGNAGLQLRLIENLFQVVAAPPENIQFRYALFDQGTGRAFQSEPVLSTAGLGIANGDRPFRHFARPITFAPLTTIRMDVTEVSEFPGELHIVLHGYKVLGGAGTPTGRAEAQARGRRSRR
jgi:hypothetical protein